MFQFKLIVAVTLTLAACCAGTEDVRSGIVLDPWNHSDRFNCNNTGYLLDACSKKNRLFACVLSTTCKPDDKAHLQKWHKKCLYCNPEKRVTRRRLAGERSDLVRHEIQEFYRRTQRIPQPWELVKFVRTKVSPPITTAEAFEYLQNFVPQARRRLCKHTSIMGFTRFGGECEKCERNAKIESFAVSRMQDFEVRSGRKPTALELTKFVRRECAEHDVDVNFTLADAYKYLEKYEQQAGRSGRRLVGKYDKDGNINEEWAAQKQAAKAAKEARWRANAGEEARKRLDKERADRQIVRDEINQRAKKNLPTTDQIWDTTLA